MKKQYSKPEIMFDSFELSQDIAAGCSVIDDKTNPELFGSDYVPGRNDGLCYHVPTAGMNLFAS